jgi:ATP-dependent Clp protease adaptor protein ClpS
VSGSLPEITVNPTPKQEETTKTRRVPPYHVVLHNDDHHSIEFVVSVIQKALGFNQQRAILLTIKAHTEGKAIIWTGPKEVAELKVEQIQTFHEVRDRDKTSLGPLIVTIEPAP